MFHDSKTDKVAFFGMWADDARDRSFLREALRICAEAAERCIDQDLRTCPDTQAALDWLHLQGFASAVARFHRAFAVHDPMEREAAVTAAITYLTRQCAQLGHSSA